MDRPCALGGAAAAEVVTCVSRRPDDVARPLTAAGPRSAAAREDPSPSPQSTQECIARKRRERERERRSEARVSTDDMKKQPRTNTSNDRSMSSRTFFFSNGVSGGMYCSSRERPDKAPCCCCRWRRRLSLLRQLLPLPLRRVLDCCPAVEGRVGWRGSWCCCC